MANGEVLALIPARGGSKSIPRKNIALLAGRSLISYAIEAARNSESVGRVIVSTDDEEIASVAKAEGAEVPFLRPPALAEDSTLILPVIRHLLESLGNESGYRPWAVALLQPTSPLRKPAHVDGAVALLRETGADSVVSVVDVPHNFNPVSLLRIEGGRLVPYLKGEGNRVLRRQDKPVVYARNGPVVLVSRYKTLMEKNELYGEDCRPYHMDDKHSIDIDGPDDLAMAEIILSTGTPS